MIDDIQKTKTELSKIEFRLKISTWVLRLGVVLLILTLMSSCACYNCPRVYKNRVGVPNSVAVPYYKNTKANKYGPKKPYYGKPEKKKRRYEI